MDSQNRHQFSSLMILSFVILLALSLFRPCLSSSVDEPVVTGDKDVDTLQADDKHLDHELSESEGMENGEGQKPAVDDMNDANVNPIETFDRLYTEGIKAYTDHLWYSCTAKIESALKDYKVYSRALTTCRFECNEGIRITRMSNLSTNAEEFAKFYTFLKTADCFRRCKEELVGNRNPVSAEIENAFEERGPYLYLQFCYFKLDKYKLAASSSYTYLLTNPEHEDTKRNIRHYRDSLNVHESDIVDLEMTPFQENYIKGVLAYREKHWLTVIKHMEQSVVEFLAEIPKCHANCYGSIKIAGTDFTIAVADAMTKIMMCQVECESKLSVIYSDPIPHILQDIFHHLQFAYYSVEDYAKCAEAIATFLHMNESHEIMLHNKESILEYTDAEFVPRQEIEQYASQRREMTDTLDDVIKNYKWADGIQTDDAIGYEDMMAELDEVSDDWMTRYERLGMHIVAKAKDLQREQRFVTDGILQAEQCDELKAVMNEIPYESSNVRFFNFRKAQQILKDDPDDEAFEASLRLLIRAAEVIRNYVQRYTQVGTTFFLKHSSIICHRPSDEEALDCFPQEDGTCISFEDMNNELSSNLFTTVTYLTNVDEDGDFYFLNGEKEKGSSFGVKCGRTVGFNTDDRHSLNLPHSKERCAFVITYSTERNDDDKEYATTFNLLKRVDELRQAKTNNSSEAVMKSLKEKGIKIVKNGTELKGDKRFLADGLASDEQCSTLQNMVQSTALAGDGYTHLTTKPSLISPHTEHEIFQGLSVYRATKLFHAKMISSIAFQTFLELSETSRILVENYFNLSTPLYFDFTHLVCRIARDDSKMERNDLSHPVHADNCVIQPDGSCKKVFPAFTQRDYSAILYMNDDFQGGEFFFAHKDRSAQMTIRPKCGRLVGFHAAEYHGVKAVLSGHRCALALWFTSDPNFKELAHIHARKILKKIKMEQEQELEEQKLKDKGVSAHEDL